ncbi:cobalt-precorrin-7 (C(5))-methyltransferase [Methanolacinia paynteri]|uniref:cobalt-precorrin-7 (C(5))-methyltransferase n=1 Tax=Methanolacinia paynteri TaxID=230356 RepID=UPI00064FAEF3|nr:cobalt-precorrin-7 (C(5))-methyltransferase [Methanolacinia paynteri]
MKIVGVGCGPGMLTEEAISAIESADLIYGSERALELASAHIGKECDARIISDYKSLRTLPDNAVILSTGDPMLAGLGYLDGEIVSGISSYQYACAKLKIPMTKTTIVNAHAKDHEKAFDEICFDISRGKIVFIIADPEFSTEKLAERLLVGSPDCKIAVCERLGYPDENIQKGDVRNPPSPRTGLFVLFVGDF